MTGLTAIKITRLRRRSSPLQGTSRLGVEKLAKLNFLRMPHKTKQYKLGMWAAAVRLLRLWCGQAVAYCVQSVPR